jgi:dipeptidyl aminopeptidase/acylaminoacyl peptidase
VEDARALLTVALQRTPQADPERIGVVGSSRGGDVALLMGIRDERVDLVAEFAGPTDFFGPFVQGAVESALRGQVPDLPGADYLNETLIQPLKRGELRIEDVRSELLRRSPVYFAAELPDLQVHHGTADLVVPVGEGERLIAVMRGLGRTAPAFEGFIYPGAGHETLYHLEAILNLRGFLTRLTSAGSAAPR